MSRFEKKFLVSVEEYLKIWRFISVVGYRDPNSADRGRYPVITEYYDSPDLAYYHDKVEGERRHIKIRRRSYAPQLDKDHFFWEAKIKFGDEQSKVRVSNESRETNDSWDFFRQLSVGTFLLPKCVVYYEREAFFIPLEEELVRINFDHNILAAKPTEDSIDWGRSWPVETDGNILMEIKTQNPEWPSLLNDFFRKVDASRSSFSKYISSIDVLYSMGEIWTQSSS